MKTATHFEWGDTLEAAHPTHSMHKAGYLHPRGEDRANQPKSLFNSDFLLYLKAQTSAISFYINDIITSLVQPCPGAPQNI